MVQPVLSCYVGLLLLLVVRPSLPLLMLALRWHVFRFCWRWHLAALL